MKEPMKIRNRKIEEWMKEGLSQATIADKLKITRQRVQQIEASLGLSRERVYVKQEFSIECGSCAKQFTTNKRSRKYCSRECFCQSRKLILNQEELEEYIETKKEKNRLKAKKYYHSVFKQKEDWKEIVKERNKRQYATQSTN